MTFVPFIKSAASLSSHDQQSWSPVPFSRGLLSSNNNMRRDKSFINSGKGGFNKPLVLKFDTLLLYQTVFKTSQEFDKIILT